ncbi:hypothetical protein CX649_07295 [Bacillaceae bacterium ZC4]|uniref:LysR family transcriptional regulator substrate-binding protein n=1 Tax=Aeribacillus sp. FSL M8-0235 TaxID=2954576 RepID=UPI001189149B|nr:hypothetical protein CX649_07295 [Bacillaceae bacterium ZC4]
MLFCPAFFTIILGYPSIEWKILTGQSKNLVLNILSHQLDVAIINNGFILDNKEIIQTTLFEERIVLIGPVDYKKDWKSLQYFIKEAIFVLPEKGMPLRNLIENQIFTPLNIYPKKLIEVNTTELIKEFVNNGVGFSFLPLSSLWQENVVTINQDSPKIKDGRKFRIIDLEFIKPTQKFIFVNLPTHNKSINKIFNILQKEIYCNVNFYKKQHEFYEKIKLKDRC